MTGGRPPQMTEARFLRLESEWKRKRFRIMKRNCSVPGCRNGKKKIYESFGNCVNPTFFSFPVNNIARCKQWLQAVGCPLLVTYHPQKLKNVYVCHEHFPDCRIHEKRKSLPIESCPYTGHPLPDDMVSQWPSYKHQILKVVSRDNIVQQSQEDGTNETVKNVPQVSSLLGCLREETPVNEEKKGEYEPNRIGIISGELSKSKKRTCCFENCKNSQISKNKGKNCLKPTYFKFPVNNISRCKQWLKAVGSQTLITYTPQKLKNVYVCHEHFPTCRQWESKRTIPNNACPFSEHPLPDDTISKWPPHEDFDIHMVKTSRVNLHCLEENNLIVSANVKSSEDIKEVWKASLSKTNNNVNNERSSSLLKTNTAEATRVLILKYEGNQSHMKRKITAESSSLDNNASMGRSNVRTTRKCCAKECGNTDLIRTLYSFPGVETVNNKTNSKYIDLSKAKRCREWVKNSGNSSLLLTDIRKLEHENFLCSDHFTNDQFNSKMNGNLKRNSIPTRFSYDGISDADMTNFDDRLNIQCSKSLIFAQHGTHTDLSKVKNNLQHEDKNRPDGIRTCQTDNGNQSKVVIALTNQKSICFHFLT